METHQILEAGAVVQARIRSQQMYDKHPLKSLLVNDTHRINLVSNDPIVMAISRVLPPESKLKQLTAFNNKKTYNIMS